MAISVGKEPKLYIDHVKDIVDWLQKTAGNTTQVLPDASGKGRARPTPDKRNWCLLQLTDVEPKTITKYFDHSKLNKDYATEYALETPTGAPVVYMQSETDALYALQKAFILRHQSRMSTYRDDVEQKDVRIHNLTHSHHAKFEHMKQLA